MKKDNFSLEHKKYINNIKKTNLEITFFRIFILILFLGIWEILTTINVLDSFIVSSPSRIVKNIAELFDKNNLLYHMGITLYETFIGFILSSLLGYIFALLLFLSYKARKIFEPYIIVLNSLPKIALGPIIIVWFGAGRKSIIFMTFLIGIIVSLVTMLNSFLGTDKNKILLLKTFGANNKQIITKLVIPNSLPTMISMLKINVGLSWIGSIMGEYLISKAGLGYLIVYGSQVFKLDLVFSSIVILCVLASLMYAIISIIEKKVIAKY